MASIQQRLQLKRSPLDTWSVREQLCLVSSVARSGDQNWVSVSRSLKTVGDPSRPPDWYNQKACAAQYGALLEHADTPKRKKRASEGAAESAQESLMKRLTQERIAEIQKVMADIAQQYQIVQEEIVEVRSPDTSEARLREMSASVDAARRQRERDQHKQAAWMKERDERRRQAEKARRPSAPTPPGVSQSPPAASPLLTSLLKNTSPTGAAPAPARLLHIPHPSTVPDKVSPSAGAPTLSMLLEKGSASLSSAPSAAPPAPSLITVYAPTLPPIQAQAQSLLVQAQPLPVQTQPLPVQSQPLPVQGQPLPVQGQPLPVQGQPLPVQGQPLPVQGQPLLVQGQPLQVQGQPLLVQAQPLPVQAQPLPVQGQQLLVHGQPLPVQGQLLPVQVQSLPVQAQSLPIQAPPSLQPSNKHAVIEQIKNQLQEIEHSLRLGNIRGSPSPVSLVPQAVLPVAPPPEQMMPVTTDKIDIDDIEIKAEDVYAFSDIDIDIPPVSTIHKNSLTRSIEKGLFNKKECLDDMSAPVEFEPPPVCTQDDSTQPRPDLPPLQSEFQAVPAAEEAVEVIPEPPPAEVKEEIPEAPQMIQAKEPQDQDNFECVPASIPLPTPLIPLPEPLIPLPEPLIPLPEPLIPLPEPLIPLPEPLIPLPASLIPLPASLIPLPAESAPAPPPEPTETTDPAVGVPERGTEEAAAPPEEASTVGPPPVPPEDQLPEEPEEPPEPAPIMSQEPPPVEEQTEVPKNEPQLEEPDQPPRDEEAGKSDAKLDEPAVTVKEESPEAEVEPEEPEALHEKVAAKEEPEPRQTEVEGPAGGEVKVEKEWDGGAEGGGGDGETAADEKPSEPEETHTETDDDTPMELIREEEKGGRKRRDYSRRKTTLPADSRACSESESTAETSAPSSPLPAPPGGGAPSSPLPATPGGGTPSTPGSATPGSTHGDPDRDHRLWKKSVMLVYSRLCAHKYASLFLRPITDEQAPDYSVVVRRPMDLTTIKRNIDAGIIRTTAEFQRDVLLMLCNALMYNPSTHRVHVMARDMQREAAAQLGMLLQAQAHAALADSAAEPPVRRSLPHNKRKRPGSPPHAAAGSPLPKTRRLDD